MLALHGEVLVRTALGDYGKHCLGALSLGALINDTVMKE